MKRIAAVLASLGVVLAVASPAAAEEHEGPPQFDPHPHILLLGVQEDGDEFTFRKCVDIAGNNSLTAIHDHMHFGQAGIALDGRAGHAIVPAAPFPAPHADPLPWGNCAEFIAFFGG